MGSLLCWSSGGGASCVGTEENVLEKGSSTVMQGVGYPVSAWLFTASGSVFMLGDGGRKWYQPAFSSTGFSMNVAFQGHSRRANNVPNVCARQFSHHYFHAVFPWVVCLPSLQKQHSALWSLIPA